MIRPPHAAAAGLPTTGPEQGASVSAVPVQPVWLRESLSGSHALSANGRAFERRLRTLATGEVFDGRHRYERALSLGRGVAEVLVHDQQTDRHTSLSLIDLHAFSSPRALSQAVQEARAVTRVHHPNVVPVGRAAVCERLGVWFQEVDPGWEHEGAQRLRAMPVSEARPRSAGEAVRFVRDAARGLAAAHAEGVFHLALTPAALRVRPLTRRVQVQGFGCRATLARIRIRRAEPGVWGAAEAGASQGSAGRWSGPPVEELGYLAPELLPGLEHRMPPDGSLSLHRVDVYGLAAVLCELLSGEPPLGRSASLSEQRQRLLAHARSVGPQAVGQLGLRQCVPRRLWRVLERALSVDPSQRHPDCDALADDLDAYLHARPTAQDAGRPLTRLGLLWLRTGPERAALGRACALIALLSLAILSLVEARDAHRALAEKQQELRQAARFAVEGAGDGSQL